MVLLIVEGTGEFWVDLCMPLARGVSGIGAEPERDRAIAPAFG